MKYLFFLFVFFQSLHSIQAQGCKHVLRGKVVDLTEGIPLENAVLYLKEQKMYATSDSQGVFEFADLCLGSYHLEISHIGCDSKQILFDLAQDTFLLITMNHHAEMLSDVQVKGENGKIKASPSNRIQAQELSTLAYKNFSEVLEVIPGVNLLRTGSGISKPIVQGLYGNRVAIVNQGVVLNGQQWGNDHAPEIDPFMAHEIQVLKGASALKYGGGNLGAVVELLPKSFNKDPHVHGNFNYNFSSNGLGHVFNAMAEQSHSWVNWRVYATYKNEGDLSTPQYFLSNTGRREANASLQLNKNIRNKWLNDFTYSLFTTELGILRGSHIGNLTDLEISIKRSEPFFTSEAFTRNISQPSQEVQHHQATFDTRYILNQNHMIQYKSSWQWNMRREFDVRRGGRGEMPALSLSQHTFWNEMVHVFTQNHWNWSSGIQYQFVNNTNVPETGILPLIPDYFQNYSSVYSILKFNKKKWNYESGIRGGLQQYEAYTITQTLPREVEVIPLRYLHGAATMQANYQINKMQNLSLQTGITQRPPEIHELFSFGLHQGISSIEEGDRNLQAETSWKSSLQWEFQPNEHYYFSAQVFYQNVQNFIYLQPQEEFRLTIRGAFPVFQYEQQDAELLGGDIYFKSKLNDHLSLEASYSGVRGYNR